MDTFYNIPEFDAWFDGGMTLAKNILKVFRNSENFTLLVYAGQENFYEEYLTKYERFVTIFSGTAHGRDVNIEENLLILNTIREALSALRKRGMLNYGHFLGAYLQIFIYMDILRGLTPSKIFLHETIGRADINETSTVADVILILDQYYHRHPRVIPFTTPTGAFGMNTFLLLYFNGVYPVAASMDPYPVHNGTFPGSVATMGHDYTHLPTLRILDGTYMADPGIIAMMKVTAGYTEQLKEYYISLKNIHESIFTHKAQLGSDTIKLLILLIFVFTHESFEIIKCPSMNLNFGSFDEVPALLRNKTYTPERYGLLGGLIRKYFQDGDVEGLPVIFRYKSKVLDEAHKILCEHFKFLLPLSH